jgi:hypothetical protein
MGGRTCFDPDQARPNRRKELQHFYSTDTLTHHHRAITINAVDLENRGRRPKHHSRPSDLRHESAVRGQSGTTGTIV